MKVSFFDQEHADFFAEKSQIPAETLIEARYERFRKF